MVPEYGTAALKERLIREVNRFYKKDERRWKAPVVEMLRELRRDDIKAVFFGGTLRSLLIASIRNRGLGRPRDIDIVVSGIPMESLRERFDRLVSRETRFGGLQLRRDEWQFDVWPLEKTWAFVHAPEGEPAFARLPYTTFFNLEAIAVDVWPSSGRKRAVYSGNDQFFQGIRTNTLEVNYEENPFPELCVVRALNMAADIGTLIGPRLSRYILEHGASLSAEDLQRIQLRHYGGIRRAGSVLQEWIGHVSDASDRAAAHAIRLPTPRQLEFWEESREAPRLRLHTFDS